MVFQGIGGGGVVCGIVVVVCGIVFAGGGFGLVLLDSSVDCEGDHFGGSGSRTDVTKRRRESAGLFGFPESSRR